jgi:hypothetical protein
MHGPAPREKVSSIDVGPGPGTRPYSSENFDRFIGPLLSCETTEAAILLQLPQFQAAVGIRGDVNIGRLHPPYLAFHVKWVAELMLSLPWRAQKSLPSTGARSISPGKHIRY